MLIFFSVTLSNDIFTPSTKQGSVLVTGQNDVGQLGLGDEVMEKSRLALLQLESNNEVIDICAGGMHTVCLTKDGKVSVIYI